jgi:hypothetical protein
MRWRYVLVSLMLMFLYGCSAKRTAVTDDVYLTKEERVTRQDGTYTKHEVDNRDDNYETQDDYDTIRTRRYIYAPYWSNTWPQLYYPSYCSPWPTYYSSFNYWYVFPTYETYTQSNSPQPTVIRRTPNRQSIGITTYNPR